MKGKEAQRKGVGILNFGSLLAWFGFQSPTSYLWFIIAEGSS